MTRLLWNDDDDDDEEYADLTGPLCGLWMWPALQNPRRLAHWLPL
jgi:hypothetical protein